MRVEYLERGRWRKFDFTLIATALALCAIGVVAIYSANMNSDSALQQQYFVRQVYWISISLAAALLVFMIDYRLIERAAYPLFFLGAGSLILVDMIGREVGGSQRWLSLGGFNLQPSELMKIIIIILIARVMDDMNKDSEIGFRDLIKPAALVSIPFFMVAKQPDLGTAMIYIIVFAFMVFFTGIAKRTMIWIGAGISVSAPVFWFLLKPYQKNRILTIINPEADPMGQGYQAIQSKIAIGSGGVWGKGIFEGTQSKLNFLPAKHTDFVFSVVAEEVGFIGSVALIILFFFLIMRILDIALHARDRFGALVTAGVCAMISFNLLYNIGMTLGLFPIVGVPLPFISYGGSALLTNFICIGLVLNVSFRRFRLE